MQFSPDQLLTCTVHDKSGHKVGKVQQVYLDDATGAPSWVTVRTGIFGTNESLVPVEQAELNGNLLAVPFDKQVIHDAPNFDPGHHLDESDEDELYRYYGMSPPASTPRTASQGQDRGEPRQQGQVGGERAHEDQIGGEPVQQPSASSNRASRGEDQRVSPARASGEYVSGSASAGEREDRDEDRRPDRSEAASPDTGTPDTGSGDSDSPDSERSDSERSNSERSDPGQERELLSRERDLLDRERELLDRERELAEQEGSVRPRLRRHDPGNRS